MRKASLVALVAVGLALAPRPAYAWGTAAHKLIMARAIELLPPELKPFFVHFRDEIVARSVDPDLWRLVPWDDDPNHFLDFGAREFGDYPFTALPREYGAAIEKFGTATLNRLGLLPWRAAEEYGNLRRTFEGFARGSLYGPGNVVLFAPVTCHYIQDATQPFHATDNHDGQRSGQTGIHARFERDLVEKFGSRLTLNPAPPTPIRNIRDAAFDLLLSSHQLAGRILEADKAAAAGKDTYDDEYFEKFFSSVQPIVERRMSDAISATAGVIIGAWEAAGKPALTIEGARPVEKVRKP